MRSISVTVLSSFSKLRLSMTSSRRVVSLTVCRYRRPAISPTSSGIAPSTGTCTVYFAATALIMSGVTASARVSSDATASAWSTSSMTSEW